MKRGEEVNAALAERDRLMGENQDLKKRVDGYRAQLDLAKEELAEGNRHA